MPYHSNAGGVTGTLHRFTQQNSHEQKFSMEFKTLDLMVVCPDEMLAVFLRTHFFHRDSYTIGNGYGPDLS